MRHEVQLHLASYSALRIGRRPRAAVTIFMAGTRTNSLTGAQACRPWTPSSTARVWALLNNVGRKGNTGWVLPVVNVQDIGVTSIQHPRQKFPLKLGYDHWGGTSPLHNPYTSARTLIGVQQHWPFSSFTSPPSTPIFDKTSHPPPHTPNSFTFKRVQTPLSQSPSRVQTRINNSLSRAQVRFVPQGFWSSYPQTLAPSPILGSVGWYYISCITLSRVCTLPHAGSLVLYYIFFQIQHDPSYVLTMCGVQSSVFFLNLIYMYVYIYIYIFFRRLATYLCHVVSLHQ